MKLERIQTVQRLPIQLEEAWDFFTSPKNLSLITPHWLDYRLMLDPPEYLHPGTIISASIRPIPVISTNIVSEITHIRPPQFYITEQRFGPFKMWHHEHHFRAIPEGVEIEDIIMYGMHFGMIGSFVHNIYLRKRLHEVFAYRAQVLEQRFGSVRKPRQPEPQKIQDIFEGLAPKPQPAQTKASKPTRQARPKPVNPNTAQRPKQGSPQQRPHPSLQPPAQQASQTGPGQQQPVPKKPARAIPDLSHPELVNQQLNAPQPDNPKPASKPVASNTPASNTPASKPATSQPATTKPNTPAPQKRPAPQNKPNHEKPKGATPGKPEPKKVTLDDIFHGTDD